MEEVQVVPFCSVAATGALVASQYLNSQSPYAVGTLHYVLPSLLRLIGGGGLRRPSLVMGSGSSCIAKTKERQVGEVQVQVQESTLQLTRVQELRSSNIILPTSHSLYELQTNADTAFIILLMAKHGTQVMIQPHDRVVSDILNNPHFVSKPFL